MSKFDFFNEEASFFPHEKYRFGQSIDYEQYSKFNDHKTPLISYDYIVLDKDKHHSFNQPCINQDDIVKYFSILKQLSSKVISKVIDEGSRDLHFHIYQPNRLSKKLRELMKEISGKNLDERTMPSIGQFALYTKESASRDTGTKSPRIYFIVMNATFYILFYDPYHEINPGKNN